MMDGKDETKERPLRVERSLSWNFSTYGNMIPFPRKKYRATAVFKSFNTQRDKEARQTKITLTIIAHTPIVESIEIPELFDEVQAFLEPFKRLSLQGRPSIHVEATYDEREYYEVRLDWIETPDYVCYQNQDFFV